MVLKTFSFLCPVDEMGGRAAPRNFSRKIDEKDEVLHRKIFFEFQYLLTVPMIARFIPSSG